MVSELEGYAHPCQDCWQRIGLAGSDKLPYWQRIALGNHHQSGRYKMLQKDRLDRIGQLRLLIRVFSSSIFRVYSGTANEFTLCTMRGEKGVE